MGLGGYPDCESEYPPIKIIYSFVYQRIKLNLYLYTMPNPKGNPQNLKPIQSDRDKPLSEYIHLRVTKEMKDEVQQKDNPPEFCRRAIQEALDKDKKENP